MALNKTLKQTFITLAIMVAIPLTCCGLPYSILWAFSPTNWVYQVDDTLPQYDDVNFVIFLRGHNDFYQDHSGPRRVMFNAYKAEPTDQVDIQIVDVQVTASITGAIEACRNELFPTLMPFNDPDSWAPTMAHWSGDLFFNIEPKSGESITVSITIKIITNGSDPETIKLKSIFDPVKIPKSAGYFLPHV